MKDLQVGKYYVAIEYGKDIWIFKADENKERNHFMNLEGQYIGKCGSFHSGNSSYNYREATQLEIDWLDLCIANSPHSIAYEDVVGLRSSIIRDNYSIF